MNFMSKKANMRQNSIITLSDQNKQEIQDLKEQKETIMKEFETKKQSIVKYKKFRTFLQLTKLLFKKKDLQNNLIAKQNLVNKVRQEIEEMSQFKVKFSNFFLYKIVNLYFVFVF
jgi:hypothetical protein